MVRTAARAMSGGKRAILSQASDRSTTPFTFTAPIVWLIETGQTSSPICIWNRVIS